jgi:IclR family KDG regulon transcriptional repressor
MATVPALERGMRTLELLVHERNPVGLSEIVRRTGIPTASCHAILHTLQELGYVSRRVSGRAHLWEPTLLLYHLGTTLVTRFGLRDVALPHLRTLAESLGCPAHAGVLVGSSVMYLEKAAAPSFIQFDTYPGKLSPFHLTALGRAIVAFLPAEEQAALLADLGPHVEQTLVAARASGYAVEDGEEVDGIGCVAAPVFGPGGAVSGSVGITGFSTDLFGGELPRVAAAVTAAAAAVSAGLGSPPSARVAVAAP